VPDTMIGYESFQPVLLATGAEDARWSGRCALCPVPVRHGDRVATLPDGGDRAHVGCITRTGSTRPEARRWG
jgi:hypothetical protein